MNLTNVGEIFWIDDQGDKWSMRMEISNARRMRDAGVDILSEQFTKGLYGDPLKAIEAIAEALRPQWYSRLTYEQFSDRLTANEDSLIEARKAFNAGLSDFHQRLGQPAMAELLRKSEAVASNIQSQQALQVSSEKVDEFLLAAQEKIAKDFDAEINRQIAVLRGT